MRYRVSGANRSTGQDQSRTIDAGSEREAREIAGRSMMVKEVAIDEPEKRAAQCANCGGVIGRLEPTRLWKDNAVCAACYTRLSTESVSAGMTGGFLDPKKNAATAKVLFRVFFWIISGAIIVSMGLFIMANR